MATFLAAPALATNTREPTSEEFYEFTDLASILEWARVTGDMHHPGTKAAGLLSSGIPHRDGGYSSTLGSMDQPTCFESRAATLITTAGPNGYAWSQGLRLASPGTADGISIFSRSSVSPRSWHNDGYTMFTL